MRARLFGCWAMVNLLFSSLFFFSVPGHAETNPQPGSRSVPAERQRLTPEQQRREVEQFLGHPVNASTPIQRNPARATRATSVAHTAQPSGGPAPPTCDDLAQTPDIQFTPEVIRTATRLEGDPERLYLFVRNGVDYRPYVGSLKGTLGTQHEFSGNDFDQASLLMALLRYSGIPSRYVFGAMYIPMNEALNWLQVDSVTAARNVVEWGGIPAGTTTDQNGNVELVIERVWVEAYMSQAGQAPNWVPMDPSFKQYQITPASPLATSVPFEESAYLSLPPSDRRTPYRFLADNLQSYLNANAPGTMVDDVIRQSSIVREDHLPGGLEHGVDIWGEASSLNDSERLLVAVTVFSKYGYTTPQANFRLPEIYGQRLTISFPPATSADEAVVQSYGGYYNTPVWDSGFHTVAAVKLNGQTVVSSQPSSYDANGCPAVGCPGYVVVQWIMPGASQPYPVYHSVISGGYYGLGLAVTGNVGLDLEERQDAYLQALQTSTDPSYDDNTTGDFLSRAALSYLNGVQYERDQIGALFSTTSLTGFTEAMVEENPEFYWGPDPKDPEAQVQFFRPQGWTIDNQYSSETLYADNGDDSNTPMLLTMDELDGSIREARLWDQATGIPSISTVTGFQIANASGIPIYTVNQSNIDSLSSTMNVDGAMLDELYSEVSSGSTVMIPRDTLTMNEWSGSVWISMDSAGRKGYQIEGWINGSQTSLNWWGGTTTKLANELKQNQNPSCSDLNVAFDADSGTWDSDFARAVAYKESGWRQFTPNGAPYWDPGTDVGTMQVNEDQWDKKPNGVTLPDGTKITVDDFQLENDWQYNVKVGSAILNSYLAQAQTELQHIGDISPSHDDLIKQAYYMYNHGSNIPPGYQYVNGTLETKDYSVGDEYTYPVANGKTKTITVSQSVLDAQDNAEYVEHYYDPSDPNNAYYKPSQTTQPWLISHRMGCTGPVQ